MAQQKKVVWSKRAQKEKLKILNFWVRQTKSSSYSKRLNRLIQKTQELIKLYPKIGRKTDISEDIRVKFIRDYELFYKITESTIYILTIWDARRNPDNLEL